MNDLVDPLASVKAYLAAEKSENTRKAYGSDFADFEIWCDQAGETALPATPIVTARYLAYLADSGLKVSTIVRRAAAIRHRHRATGHEPPTNAEGVKAVLRGIRRQVGVAPVRKLPATSSLLHEVLAKLPSTVAGLRDRAILLIGFAAALRRSELVSVNVESIDRRARGILLHIGRSKTDQEGKGAIIPIPNGRELKPVDALDAWLKAAAITSGPVFRQVDRHGNIGSDRLTDRSVARIVKRAVGTIGLNVDDFSGHSLRAGFVTTSLDQKVDPFRIMKTTRHARVDTLKIYDRRENDFDTTASEGFL